uniref:C2H2-type domain-containing protein n=1 Tax=viral metagenome TaxID=1070528 RepID=A0A6C0ARF8_9ZZZZ
MNKLDNNIPNRIKQPSQCCVHCGKSYVKRSNLDKHIIICDLLQKSKKIKNMEEDEEPLPSQRKMFQMLIELGQKYNKLEEKVEEMGKWIVKKKKKINMLDWLNTNISPSIIFDEFYDKIIITENDIQFLLNNSFYDSLNEVFSKTIYDLSESDIPIYAFIQKTNTFYIYDREDLISSNGQKKWIEFSREKIIKFFNKIHMKFIKIFCEWKKNHSKEIKESYQLASLCDKTTTKLMTIELKVEAIFNKLRTILYNTTKKDIKAFVEYEFEF